jgi:drug/metabolite transporter (DMT)-like permease
MRPASDLRGIAAMLLATASFVVCDSFMKLVMEDLPPFEVLFLRGVFATLIGAVILLARSEMRHVGGAFHPRALGRAAGETASVLCYIVALARLPIADAIAIMQVAPLMLILGAAVLLREPVGARRLALVVAGFAGALLVAQPGVGGVSPAAGLAFASALLIAVRDLVGRGVPLHVPVMVVAFVTNVMVMAAAGITSLGLETWTPPSGRHLLFLGCAGLFLTIGHFGIISAYRTGRTAAVAPFFYSFALWAVVAGLVVWGVLPNALALAGIALIAGSGIALVLLDRDRAMPGEEGTVA